ncbi:hypothetical protein GTX53_03590 [Streptomyces sp. SID5594]|uniref:hypothetical protein n=1 Tax=Streptomyces TaxID=1883 RepID=UPI0003A99E9F|nr:MULTISPECIES: hypothetical protein [unclassified Streptomyces]MZF52939.1 hypothetical protein [Streptomyces sp. SID5594]
MAQEASEERHPREGRRLDRQGSGERPYVVSYSTSTSTARRLWWKARSVLRRPVKGTGRRG